MGGRHRADIAPDRPALLGFETLKFGVLLNIEGMRVLIDHLRVIIPLVKRHLADHDVPILHLRQQAHAARLRREPDR